MPTFTTDDTLTRDERELAALILREYADDLEEARPRPGEQVVTGAWELRQIAHKLEWGG